MYLSFYGLRREPFHITPDPEFMFLSPSHREALASLVYGVEKRKGFLALTGEVGTGKTTILREFLSRARGKHIHPIYIFDPYLSFDDLLRLLLAELDADDAGDHAEWTLGRLQEALVRTFKSGKNVALLIDEAQNMPVETLEKLRTLSNLETNEEKLLQIVLVGQPELDEKLSLHALRQLRQRIAVRAIIRPLSRRESRDYIKHRIEAAWGSWPGVFSKGAIRLIARSSRGVPRTINILCDNALIAGFGLQQRPVKPKLVRTVIHDLNTYARPRRFPLLRVAAVAAVVALLLLPLAHALQQNLRRAPGPTAGGRQEPAAQVLSSLSNLLNLNQDAE